MDEDEEAAIAISLAIVPEFVVERVVEGGKVERDENGNKDAASAVTMAINVCPSCCRRGIGVYALALTM